MKYILDEEKMRVALDEARKALDIDEEPVGAATVSYTHLTLPTKRIV